MQTRESWLIEFGNELMPALAHDINKLESSKQDLEDEMEDTRAAIDAARTREQIVGFALE